MFQCRLIPPVARVIGRIGYAIDLGCDEENGLRYAIQLARNYGAELLLIHILPPPTPIFEIESPMQAEAEIALSGLLGTLKKMEIKARGLLLNGATSIAGQISRAAEAEHIDLIIIGARRRTGLTRLLAGSLVAQLVDRCYCPVLVVPNSTAA